MSFPDTLLSAEPRRGTIYYEVVIAAISSSVAKCCPSTCVYKAIYWVYKRTTVYHGK